MFSYTGFYKTKKWKNNNQCTLQAQSSHKKQGFFLHMKTCCKRTLKSTSQFFYDKTGSATLEATLICPIFLFAFLSLLGAGRCLLINSRVYEALVETGCYMAEYAYLYSEFDENGQFVKVNQSFGDGMAKEKLRGYLGESPWINQYIENGINGISFSGSSYLTEGAYISLQVTYEMQVSVPIIGTISLPVTEQIRQKAYVGYWYGDEEEEYVYVAENGSVYHLKRSCTHIKLSICEVSRECLLEQYGGLRPCEYCVQGEAETGHIYITELGDCYHYAIGCSGLKRTVYRVKKSETGGLSPCERCGY